MSTAPALTASQRANFETLQSAFRNGDAALLSCLTRDGQHEAVICAAFSHPDGDIEFVPFARLFTSNPYELLQPPNEEDEA